MRVHREKIPGYKILLASALAALVIFGATQVITHHKTPFERMTGYEDIDALIQAKIAYEEQVAGSIRDLGGPGDDYTKGPAGDKEAEYRLGKVYLYGNDHEKRNLDEARKWFAKSAAQHYAPAEYEMGRLYANGTSEIADKAEAVKWYLRAANGGYKWAQIHLGEIYMHFLAEKFGAVQNDAEAYFWLSLGAETEDFNSDFVRDRDAAKANLKPGEIDAIEKRLADWKRDHPAEGTR